jgi:cytochrome c biogenesis protein CcmG/thiol:disulfide interchange protein DsbE
VLIVVGFATWAQQPTQGQGGKTVRANLEAAGTRRSAPNFELLDTNGKVVHLSDYRGRAVLLDFWATTCGGCVEEIPAFIEIAATYQGQGLTTIGVAEDIAYANLKDANEAWSRVRPFVRDRKLNYLILMGDSQVTRHYDIKALPLTYLIDSAGRVAATYLGVVDRENLEHNIRTLLAEGRR